MVSFSNGSLSGEASNKRPLENGYVPKYKPRKVSTFREFPPMCGPNVVPVNLKPEENGSGEPGIMDAVGVINLEMTNPMVANAEISGVADSKESELVGNSEMPKIAKLNEIKDFEIQNAVVPNGVEHSSIKAECQSHEAGKDGMDVTESLDAIVGKVMADVNVSTKSVMEIAPLGIQFPDKVGSQRYEAVNNPIQMEGYELLDAYVGKVTTTIMNGFLNEVEELIPETNPIGVGTLTDMKSVTDSGNETTLQELSEVNSLAVAKNSGVDEAKPSLYADASVEKELLLGNPQALSSLSGGIKPETSIRPKDKYRPRRVSAFREFPPNCGTPVPLPIVEEKQMVVSGNDCLKRIEKVELAAEAAMMRDVSEKGTRGEVPTSSQKGRMDGLQDVPINNETTETLSDGFGRGLLGESAEWGPMDFENCSRDGSGRGLQGETAEGGPMDFENCNRDLQPSIIERTGASPGSGVISKAVNDNSIKDTGGPVGKEIAVYSPDRNDNDGPQHSDFGLGNDSNGEIVHGLMAAPYCPWTKSKDALKNSDGGTSGLKMKQPNLSQIEMPKAVALNSNLESNYSGGSPLKNAFPDSYDADARPGSLTNIDEGDRGTYDQRALEIAPISMFKDVPDNSDNDYAGPIRKDIIVYSPGDSDEMRPSHNVNISEDEVEWEVVHGLMAEPYCPWRKAKTGSSNLDGEMSGEKKSKKNVSWRKKAKAVARKSNPIIQSSGSLTKKRNKVHFADDVDGSPGALMLADDGGHAFDGDSPTNTPANQKPREFEVSLPPFGPNSSGHGGARDRVRETLRLFHAIYRKLLQQEEAHSRPEEEGKSRQSRKKPNRIDLMTAKALKNKGKLINTAKMIGQVPGVEVGDEFQYRVELAVVGIHFPYQSGIDSMKLNEVPVATSIVASGGYSDNLDDADVLIYSGQGGNVVGNAKAKQPQDQKLERGNLALRNSITAKTPVRVVRGWKETKIVDPLDPKPKMVMTYIYDGLYTVTKYWIENGRHGKQVFQFELKRNPGQPELAWKELKKSNKFKNRPGTCITDISGGKEPFPICAVNTLDNEKPPPFIYISKMMYPNWYVRRPPPGCDCKGRCSDSRKCRCAVINGGEIPYNRNGALVETKALVYECGPHCKCPPSCYNRVSQRGIKFQLEVFKTESRGWGVRALTSIPSGSFICEYAGELLEEKEAEQRIGNDEYLFDIGQNYIDSSKPEEQEMAAELTEEAGFTIDACQYGNVGRFINHSCLPNLHAQNVIYDHEDKRMPHIMLFAMENIPPLQELTYHYNYTVDQVCDSAGNIKVKKCYCGAARCAGRMY